MKPQLNKKIEFFVYDWNPNGTNDLSLIVNGGISKWALDEVTFGIDINRFDPIELEPGLMGAIIPLKIIVEHLATSPLRTAAESYKRLMAFVNGGAM